MNPCPLLLLAGGLPLGLLQVHMLPFRSGQSTDARASHAVLDGERIRLTDGWQRRQHGAQFVLGQHRRRRFGTR